MNLGACSGWLMIMNGVVGTHWIRGLYGKVSPNDVVYILFVDDEEARTNRCYAKEFQAVRH